MAKPDDGTKSSKGSIVGVPIPISSPALGSGVVPVVAYIFPLGKSEKPLTPSVIGAAGLFTNNGSRGFAIGGQLYAKKDRLLIETGYVHGNLNYDLYGLGLGTADLKLPLKQAGEAFAGSLLLRVKWKMFVGPDFLRGSSLITIRQNPGNTVPIPPDLGLSTSLTAVGARLRRDTSSNRFYPTNGTYLNLGVDVFSNALGSKYSFESYRGTFNKYMGLTEKQVLAYNLYGCATGGTPPFYGNCVYGTNNVLRGYVAGRYLDRYMIATQLEYRLTLPMRFGVVAFGGIGEVIPGGNQVFRQRNFLPAGGIGVRFLLSKQYHVNLRADLAQGKDGHTFSLGIGEAF